MKTAKSRLHLLPLLALALAWAPDARAASETVNGITWNYTVSNGKATLTMPAVPKNTTGAITIPSTLGGCPVTDIQALGFHDCNGITSVTIGNNVTTIGSQAFYQCSGLTSVTIGDSVTTIAAQVFAGCPNLASVTIGNGVTTIGDIAFLRCSNLTNVTIGAKVTTIGNQAFRECSSLTSLMIPDSVTTIGSSTFSRCNSLQTLYVPESLRNSLANAGVPSACGVFGYALANDQVTITSGSATGIVEIPSVLLGYPVVAIGGGAFSNASGLTSVAIPASVTTIGNSAFSGCSGLKALYVPESLRNSLANAGVPSVCGVFGYALANDQVTITSGSPTGIVEIPSVLLGYPVVAIGGGAFRNATGLTSVAIPASVTAIGNSAFSGCSALQTMYVPESLRNSLANAGVPSVCGVLGYALANDQITITSGPTTGIVEIPSVLLGYPVVAIGGGAFRNATGLTSVAIPASVTSIGESAFSGCSGLTSMVIPDGVTTIGASAFAGCVNLADMEIPASVVDLPLSAFDGCGKLWPTLFRRDDGPQAVSLTVTNVVVHFVTQSVPSAAVTPATNATGIVNIIAEVTASNAVAIAQDWAAQYPGFEAAFGTDFTAALTMETGKRDGSGRPLRVWQDYVAGTDPTDPASLFAASIVHDAQTGDMIVSCSPELAPAEAAKRRYSVYGKANLADPGWTLLGTGLPWRTSANSVFHFFRVTVEMR